MKLNRLNFHQGPERPRPLVKRVFFAALLVALGAMGVSGYIANDLRARGDRDHLENPGGLEMAGSMRPEDRDPRVLNGEAIPFLGTTWIELVALAAGIVAVMAGAWLCMRHAVETGLRDTARAMAPRASRVT
ncbi:MAG: hypothetical protein O2894_14270 [Planctomycetota bacterium]|nr:hypothetical protein [Planctomycetota bacterium]